MLTCSMDAFSFRGLKHYTTLAHRNAVGRRRPLHQCCELSNSSENDREFASKDLDLLASLADVLDRIADLPQTRVHELLFSHRKADRC